ncbi:dihydroxyacetone kinase subunit DhaL [Conexibacter woesei]|uniref:Dihydroxyacetone kinase, L subunit n=1 Tax=Conexibacter woesei (strain DSM 14684 / CCUG 47730 / CIP 108061 / JCM 11494 / NBRC 100937 / ID131577) TaxID=469383 RepID=D3F3G8_CONWI|nr:dihydroxyacetone kinase subunit DhaL [Conexibacter woesei]ADB52333.1 dihydroxyacetone kinase, L subunit [Conexibacter woesei DSM 14684]
MAVQEWVKLSAARLEQHRDRLNRLDADIGDGDHGANMARGFAAAAARLDGAPSDQPAMELRAVGMTLLSTVGGAAGPLYGSFFIGMATALRDAGASLDAAAWARALEAGAAGVQRRGKAEPGDKTMVDALLPARDALATAAADGASLAEALRAAASAADAGADATIPLLARKGRASYLGERSVGHLDPGAVSSALLLRTAADAWGESTE